MPAETISAAEFVPASRSLSTLRRAAAGCRGCPLWRDATQTVFGAGTKKADLMLVGEQPGDREDVAGEPFVGPAGSVLAQALEAAELDPGDIYLTNAVKHFKWRPRGKRRLHQTPRAGEVEACKPARRPSAGSSTTCVSSSPSRQSAARRDKGARPERSLSF